MNQHMNRLTASLGCGFLFAVGLALSGMTRPSKIVGFLDVTGDWDPSLMCVMGGGLLINWITFRFIFKRAKPILDEKFHVPVRTAIDTRLIAGSAIFGIGWGLGGYCPGPGVVALASGATSAFVFVGGLLGGTILYNVFLKPRVATPEERITDL